MDMRKLLAKALPAFFDLADKGSVTVTYRGLSGNGEKLYKLSNHKGEALIPSATYKQVLTWLAREEREA